MHGFLTREITVHILNPQITEKLCLNFDEKRTLSIILHHMFLSFVTCVFMLYLGVFRLIKT